jgi:predicted CopG family antitoxin
VAKSVPATQLLQVINVRSDVTIHVKHDTFVKLAELKARLRKRSYDEVIKELIDVYEKLVQRKS